MEQDKIQKLKEKAKFVRRQTLEIISSSGKGHIGGSFSSTDILVALYYGGAFRFDSSNLKWDKRDRFILSKGHSATPLYVILSDLGFFPASEFNNFQKENCILGGHPDRRVGGIDVDTGSLGHGLGIGAGLALSAKMDKSDFLTYVLMGDGECYEGSIWEAAMFSSHHKLNNLIGIVDKNNLCILDFTKNCVEMEPLEDKWKSFGWDVVNIDGHSFEELNSVFSNVRLRQSDKPLMIIANTIKGKGVSFMENKPEWHHSVPNQEQLEIARKELG